MVWREPKKHHADCYFCMVYTKGFNSKVKHAASNPDFPSAKTIISRYPIIEDHHIQISHHRRPVDHCAEVPISVFSGLPSLHSEDSCSSSDEDDVITDLDFHISTLLEPSPFKQEELSDLVKDLCSSKQQSEVLASRLQQKALLCPNTKVTFYGK